MENKNSTKKLYLLRHAESNWGQQDFPDFERKLNEQGKLDAPIMGKRLAARDASPDIVIASTAKRAIETAKIITQAIGFNKEEIKENRKLYLASTKEILNIILSIDDANSSAMLIGHNPGFTELANSLSDLKIDNMPTCSIFCVEFKVDSWKEISQAQGKYKFFDYPKN